MTDVFLPPEAGTLRLSVILPNFNGRSLLEKNLPLLFAALRQAGVAAEVIVADDASQDDSVSYLQGRSDVVVLRQPFNRGFSSTCNLGLKHARGELICIANTDVQFDPDYFVQALAALRREQADFVKGPILNHHGDPAKPHSVDRRVKLALYRGMVRSFPEHKRLRGPFELSCRLGCCFVARAAALRALDGYDELFSPYYWEDVDLGWRAARRRYRVVFEEQARVFHEESSTISKLARDRRRHIKTVVLRNQLLLTWRMLAGAQAWGVHVAWQIFYVLTRWLALNFYYYHALIWAWARRRGVRIPP